MGLLDRVQHAFNAFANRDPTPSINYGVGTSYRPDRSRTITKNERSMITSIYNRIAVDCSQIAIRHIIQDDEGRFVSYVKDELDDRFNFSANVDQTGTDFLLDLYESLLQEGDLAVMPVEMTRNPKKGTFKIHSMRTAKILEYYPSHVKVRAYDERDGQKKEVILSKASTMVMQNPFYTVMNGPNSQMQRLIRKLNLLDSIDEQSGSGKLDLIIQLPYVIKGEARKAQAEDRRKNVEDQLSNSKYGVAYTDSAEKVTQLNRPIENNLLSQIEYLTNQIMARLGMTQAILDGTADEATMNNYYARICEPIVDTVKNEANRKFLTKTARTQGHIMRAFKDPFKLVPITELIKLSDTFTRNEIMTSNEVRQIMGLKPSTDPNADQLRNKNLNQSTFDQQQMAQEGQPLDGEMPEEGGEYDVAYLEQLKQQLAELDDYDAQLDELEKGLR